jgi:hypothetical protein
MGPKRRRVCCGRTAGEHSKSNGEAVCSGARNLKLQQQHKRWRCMSCTDGDGQLELGHGQPVRTSAEVAGWEGCATYLCRN